MQQNNQCSLVYLRSDTVPRPQLLKRFLHNALPAPLLRVIREMYEKDKSSVARRGLPSNAVQQEFPLPHLLFLLYINDVCREVGLGCAVMGDRVNCVCPSCCMLMVVIIWP